jgi:hypothetical protein
LMPERPDHQFGCWAVSRASLGTSCACCILCNSSDQYTTVPLYIKDWTIDCWKICIEQPYKHTINRQGNIW